MIAAISIKIGQERRCEQHIANVITIVVTNIYTLIFGICVCDILAHGEQIQISALQYLMVGIDAGSVSGVVGFARLAQYSVLISVREAYGKSASVIATSDIEGMIGDLRILIASFLHPVGAIPLAVLYIAPIGNE